MYDIQKVDYAVAEGAGRFTVDYAGGRCGRSMYTGNRLFATPLFFVSAWQASSSNNGAMYSLKFRIQRATRLSFLAQELHHSTMLLIAV